MFLSVKENKCRINKKESKGEIKKNGKQKKGRKEERRKEKIKIIIDKIK